VTLGEAADLIREIQAARPGEGTLLWRCAEAVSFLLEVVERLEQELDSAYEAIDE
jgi:hypothetical protein